VKGLVDASVAEKKKDRRTNFFYVASRASSCHLAYHRDLPLLLTLSMVIEEYSLALDLGTFCFALLSGRGWLCQLLARVPLFSHFFASRSRRDH